MAKPGLESNRAQGGLSELKRRLLFVLGAIIVFRAGSFVPIPGIDAAVLAQLFEQQKDTIVAMFNMFSGGALRACVSICVRYHAVYLGFNYYAACKCGSSTFS